MSGTTGPLSMVALAALLAAGLSAWAGADSPAQAERASDHAIGAAGAPLVMVEYASFACPHCAHFQTEAWPVIRTEFVETGLVRYIFRPMLTPPAQIAAIGMVIADCAAEDRYFDAVDLLFTEQGAIIEAAQGGGDVVGIYNRIGAAVGLAPDDILVCLNAPDANASVTDAASQAQADGIRGTPTFIIGGEILSSELTAEGVFLNWGGEPFLLNGQRVPGHLDGDSIRRIILHFLERTDSEP